MEPLLAEWWWRAAAGAAGSGLAAAAAYRARSLSRSGAWAAFLMGTLFVVWGGPVWIGTLIAFFVSSSALSKVGRRHRRKAAAEAGYAKTGRRDAGQVWANGGLGLLLCAANAALPHPLWFWAFLGAMAAVNADTWATELGALSRTEPRAVLTGRRVPAGTSGGVTPLGTLAALAGAAFIGGCAAALLAASPAAPQAQPPGPAALLIAAAAAAGLAGAFADSALGAAAQAMFRCRVCGSETERAEHCGAAAEHVRGFAWLGNDAVNLLASLAAACLGALAGLLFG